MIMRSREAPSGVIDITEWNPAEEVFKSEFGELSFAAWATREADRIVALDRPGADPVYVKLNGGRRMIIRRGDPDADYGVVHVGTSEEDLSCLM